jgi:hypothetical protein
MNESDLRAVLLLRAIESSELQTAVVRAPMADVPGHDTAPDWAGAEARRRLGEQASPPAWLAERARLRLARLGEQQPAWRPVLDAADLSSGRGWAPAWLLAAALLGALGEQIGSSRFIHLLAPPLLGLLLWNGAVYGLLLAQALRRRPAITADAAAGPAVSAGSVGLAAVASSGALRRTLLDLAIRGRARLAAAGSALDAPRAAAYARFQRDWLALSAPWQSARALALLHAAAGALALGALASWYARGLVLDYRAGWDSTFLDASQVRLLLGWVLGPAAALTGQPLPDTAALASLRAADGGGESAARWIHLWSLTLLAAVVLPRMLLAARAAWRARQWSQRLPLPDDDGLRRLLRAASGQRLTLAVLPYSYRLAASREPALRQQLDHLWGPGVLMQLQPSLPMGAEDELPRHLPAPLADRVVVLFAMTATPERETHGAFLRALAALRGPGAVPLEVLVDESGFRQRLTGATLAERLAQRRAAWQALLDAVGPAPLAARFIDLGAAPTVKSTAQSTAPPTAPAAPPTP